MMHHRSKCLRSIFSSRWAAVVAAALLFIPLTSRAADSETTAAAKSFSAAEQRLFEAVRYLASDELEGRGVDTAGIQKAADFVVKEFQAAGLKTDVVDGGPFQPFTMTVKSELGDKEKNQLKLVGPAAKDGEQATTLAFELGKTFNTLAIGGTHAVDAPVVFAGFGITAPEHEYDDFDGIDVEGKVVVVIRKEPQQDNPHSVFDGTKSSRHAFFTQKVSNAFQHGAAAVIMVNDGGELQAVKKADEAAWQKAVNQLVKVHEEFRAVETATDDQRGSYRIEVAKLAKRISNLSETLERSPDRLLDFRGAGTESGHPKLPVFFTTRAAIGPMIQAALGKSLDDVEREIDEDLNPRSTELTGWTAVGESNVVHQQAEVKNVIGVLAGEGPLADETIVIGAHYDHIGMGGNNSLAPGTIAIHNGADDNASGTSALVEVARRLAAAETKPKRRLVFIAFTGEESGLLGSAHYIANPIFPLEKTVAMVNMDMVGRLNENKLIVYGTGTAEGFDKLIDDLNEKHEFAITKDPGGFGPSDHASFYAKEIPVFHVFTGTHNDYHRPSDDVDKINVAGMSRVVDFVTDIVRDLDGQASRPKYVAVKPKMVARGGSRPYLGSIPDFSQKVEGYALMGVAADSPAERAGMKSGDVIVKFGDSKIGGLEDIDGALRNFKAGDSVPVVVQRDGKPVTVNVVLDPPR